MAVETAAPIQETPAPAPIEPSAPEEKYFDVDEATLASIPPEVRQSVVDPLITKITTQVKDRFSKVKEEATPFRTKAEALDKLIADPRFQKWYVDQQNPVAKPATENGKPAPLISPEEWDQAYQKAAQGDLSALNSLQEKQLDLYVKQKYAPIIEHTQSKMKELEMTMELNDLFSNHEDAKELDSIRVNPSDPKSPSLLEMCLHYISDKGGRPFEESYQAAKKMADQMRAQAKNAAMGLVADKKAATIEQPTRSTGPEENIQYVNTPQEALKAQLLASLKGQNISYRVKPRQK